MKKINLQFLFIALLINVYISNKILAQTDSERLTNIAAGIPVIDKLFENYAKQHHFPGLVYGLIIDGNLFHTGHLGYSNITEKNLTDGKSAFRIASMTKSFTAMAILNQRKNELIQLLPEWRNSDTTHIFAENFFMDYYPESLRKEAINMFKEAGNIIHIQEMIPENNLRGSFIMEGEYIDIEIGFTLTPENPPLIQQYYIKKKKKGN